MSNTPAPAVRHPARPDAAAAGPRTDPRAARTTQALGGALVALLHERPFDAITVQEILDRAGVARATFYAHYRNKHDVLFSGYEGLLERLEPLVDRPSRHGAPGARLFPVAEFVLHVGEARRLVDALARDGLLDDAWAMLAGAATRVIHRRLDAWCARQQASWRAGAAASRTASGTVSPGPDAAGGAHRGIARGRDARPMLAPMLAGAIVEGVRWWSEHPDAATAEEMDVAFHELARGVLHRRPAPSV